MMLATLNDEFSRRFEQAQPDEILQRLKECFHTLDDVEWYRVSCAIYNAKMSDSSSITDQVLYMIEMIEWMDELGYPLHE